MTKSTTASPEEELLRVGRIPHSHASRSEREIEKHSFDALRPYRGFGLPSRGFPPDYVLTPSTTEEVAHIVRAANSMAVPIVPWGGGTGLMGGAVAVNRGVVVDFRRMNKIIRLDKTAGTVQVQAGATLGALNRHLGKYRLFFAHDPWTRDYATVGGAISTNGMGYYGGKFGTMGDQVLGLKAVLADGSIIDTPGIPNSTVGMDLKEMMIGTEGTIGLIAEATLRCHPKPEAQEVLAYRFRAFEDALGAALKLREVGVDATSLDVISDGDKETCKFYLVLTGFRQLVQALERRSRTVLESSGGKSLRRDEADSYWKHRHDIATQYERSIAKSPFAQWRAQKTFDFLHVALPVGSVLKYKREILKIAEKHGITVDSYGLWIKPELFQTTFVRDENRDGAVQGPEDLESTIREGLNLAISLGGAFEYCHGVGVRLDEYMAPQHGPALEVMRKVKAALDTNAILNPGKLALSPDTHRR